MICYGHEQPIRFLSRCLDILLMAHAARCCRAPDNTPRWKGIWRRSTILHNRTGLTTSKRGAALLAGARLLGAKQCGGAERWRLRRGSLCAHPCQQRHALFMGGEDGSYYLLNASALGGAMLYPWASSPRCHPGHWRRRPVQVSRSQQNMGHLVFWLLQGRSCMYTRNCSLCCWRWIPWRTQRLPPLRSSSLNATMPAGSDLYYE